MCTLAYAVKNARIRFDSDISFCVPRPQVNDDQIVHRNTELSVFRRSFHKEFAQLYLHSCDGHSLA